MKQTLRLIAVLKSRHDIRQNAHQLTTPMP
jgi:hypothetical protein